MKIKIYVNSEAQAKFWVRVFRLEAEIEAVRKLMDQAGPRKWASVPVINEFKIDKDLEFCCVLLFTVDAVGPNHVIGSVFICDQPNREEILRERDRLAAEVMKFFHERHDKIVAEGKGEYHDQITVIEPGREEEGPGSSHERPSSASQGPPDPDL